MKHFFHKLSFLFLLLLLTSIFAFHLPDHVSAQTHATLSASTQATLSDMIYADLAVRGYLDNVSIVYKDGKATNDIQLNSTRHWLPASTVKTYAAMYAFKLISEGKLHLSDSVTIDAKNEVPTELVTDELPTLLIGDTVTIDRLIRQMITQSDNTAFNQLLDTLGRDNITQYIQSLGLIQSHVGSKLNLDDSQTQYEYDAPGYGINSTTAEDYAKAFLLIKNNKIPGAKNLFAVLAQQKINNMIPFFLPKTVVCAHKTGDLDPLYHDGGICQDKTHSYVLTIFTNAGDPNLLAHLSQIIYTKNFQLVGQSLDGNQSVSENTQAPIDELVMNPSKTSVLGATTTINFPTPDITAADLGIKASDLSLSLNDSKLPKVIIPADSPFHIISDSWQLTQLLFALGPQARMAVNLQTAELRIAEAKDLFKRGKTQKAEAVLGTLQQGLTTVSKDSVVKSDATVQTTIQAISETRFTVLGKQLQKVSGNEKVALIKQIAAQAKETIQQVQPETPEAVNATSPTQRPLIGTIVSSTPTTITVKTSGGQEITIPQNNIAITIKGNATSFPTPTFTTPSISPSISPTTNTLAVGAVIALVGSTLNNHFTPSLILTNVPKELAAPEPVIVAKVDVKHNTMVVEENGVYTQVNINKNTNIKGADTNIPLKSIQAGDIVIVHGAPLTQLTPQQAPVLMSPTIANTPIPATSKKASSTSVPLQKNTSFQNNPSTITFTPAPTYTVIVSPTSSITQRQPVTQSLQHQAPNIIQGTSIQVIEKKYDIPSSAPSQNSQPNSQPKNQLPQTHPHVPNSIPPSHPDNILYMNNKKKN